ncbi:LPS-assembly protein LptD [Prosthecomicrobium pneumaticum]|uniref:LPS-assembly protein LptD n=1 Tax=Prosthecomicrobium pneumaticum TaxID=81895 RepID=A0A7W9FKV3_9HYPH|nr:LPS-assembly protein LptD [Prosthecomicrobium pneumaticum]MBB5751484.1 LPS-assembly protein [Prosthecomicrobium pneumaticum]
MLGSALVVAGLAGAAVPAFAQTGSGQLGFGFDRVGRPAGNAQMLLDADQLIYDYDAQKVSAAGSVKIYYDGYTLEADKVTYDQKSGRMTADGRVKIVDREGSIVTADSIDVTDSLSDGFVEALRLDTPTQTHFAAERARRDEGKRTTFYRGVYTACEPCRDRPNKAPLWQVKAARIVVDHVEHLVHFRSAQLEFLGVPVAWVPVFSAPDPTTKRKSGFLPPSVGYTSNVGAYARVPYFWALAPNYDLTLSPTAYTQQGFLALAEWRHRLDNGQYTLSMAGISQSDPDAFYDADSRNSGVKDFRGGIRTTGEFYLNDKWTFGWDTTVTSDRTFTRDYDVLNSEKTVAVSSINLTGESERNWFDARGYYFQVLSNDKDPRYDQERQAVVHPVIDHDYTVDHSVFGGEVSVKSNFVSLSRDETDFVDRAGGATGVYDPGIDRVLGASGLYNRLSSQVTWERTVIGPMGVVLKPFGYLRGDAYYVDPDNNIAGLSDSEGTFRGMPAVGLEARWPIMTSVGATAHIFEPIAQAIVRPNEQDAGYLPNEDAQSLVFDDSSLFDWDKFSGYDRIEGGTRVNVGLHYLGTFGTLASVDALVGQSFQVAGQNPYAVDDLTGTGLVSGLETDRSDYVGRVTLDTGYGYFLTARTRLDESDFTLNRAELTATGRMGAVTASTSYLFLRDDPETSDSEATEAVSVRGSWQFAEYWRAFGSVGYDIHEKTLASSSVGLAYDDECTTFSIAYSQVDKDYSSIETTKKLMMKLELRTLGGAGVQTDLSNLN